MCIPRSVRVPGPHAMWRGWEWNKREHTAGERAEKQLQPTPTLLPQSLCGGACGRWIGGNMLCGWCSLSMKCTHCGWLVQPVAMFFLPVCGTRSVYGSLTKGGLRIGLLEKPRRLSGTTSLFLAGQFPRLSGWCSRWAPRLVQPVNWLAGAASQRSNSMVSHTKYFKRAKNWIVSLYGPFFELAHICAIFPM